MPGRWLSQFYWIDFEQSASKIHCMNYRKVIAEAWVYTQQNKRLIIWFGFLPSIFTTTVAIGYLAYQFFAFKNSFLFDGGDENFFSGVLNYIWIFFSEHLSWTVPLIIVAIIFAIFYFLFPTLAKAASIQMIARNRSGQKAGVGTGLKHGLMSFLQLFEYHLLIRTFGFFTILIEMSLVLRTFGISAFMLLLPVFILLVIVSFLLTLLFVYSDFYIVIDDKGVFESMKKSASLVVRNWKHTFLITILMLIIGVRIIIQAIMVFLIPALIVLISGYIATITLPVTGVIVGGAVGLVTLFIASYLNGIVDIFSYTVWTFTFLDLSEQKEFSARGVEMEDSGGDHKNLNE